MSERIGRWTYNDESTRYGEAGWHLDGGPIVLDHVDYRQEWAVEGSSDAR